MRGGVGRGRQGLLALRSPGLSLVLVSCFLMVVASGCRGALPAGQDPVTIRFVPPGSADAFVPLIEAFEREQENVSIELVSDAITGLEDLTAADVTFAYQIWMPEMIDRGYPVSLNAFITEDDAFSLDDFYPGTVEAFSTQGRVWGVPYMAEMIVMYYNRDLFDRYGVDYPNVDWTWDDFLIRAQRLTHPDDGVYGYAMAPPEGDLGAVEGLLWMTQAGGGLYDDLLAPTQLTFDDPRNVAALEWYADLIYVHGVTPMPEERGTPYPSAGITTPVQDTGSPVQDTGERYAMWMGGLSDDRDPLSVGRAPLPRGEVGATFGTVVGLMIAAEAEDPQACWDWVAFVSENPPPALMPARRSLGEAGATGTLPPGALEAARASMPHLRAFLPTSQGELDADAGAVLGVLGEVLAQIQDGESVRSALADAQARVE